MIYEIVNETYSNIVKSYSKYTHDQNLIQLEYRTQSIPESLVGFNVLTDKGCLFVSTNGNQNSTRWHLYNLFTTKSEIPLSPIAIPNIKNINQENRHILLLSKDSDGWYIIPNYIGHLDYYYYTIDCDWIKVGNSEIHPNVDGYYKLDEKIDKLYISNFGFYKPYEQLFYNIREPKNGVVVELYTSNNSGIHIINSISTSNNNIILEVW